MGFSPPGARRTAHREREIIEALRLNGGSSRIQPLAAQLGVSEETIRRNVKKLADDGRVRKVHGGVHLPDAEPGAETEPSFAQRMDRNPEAKRRIAARVAAMVGNGDSLILDIGSTTAYIARALRRHRDLFVVTNSVAVAHLLAARNNNRVFMAGGELRAHDGGAFGAESNGTSRSKLTAPCSETNGLGRGIFQYSYVGRTPSISTPSITAAAPTIHTESLGTKEPPWLPPINS